MVWSKMKRNVIIRSIVFNEVEDKHEKIYGISMVASFLETLLFLRNCLQSRNGLLNFFKMIHFHVDTFIAMNGALPNLIYIFWTVKKYEINMYKPYCVWLSSKISIITYALINSILVLLQRILSFSTLTSTYSGR